MRCLATGANCLPAAGIGAVAEQLAARLPAGAVRLGTRAAGACPIRLPPRPRPWPRPCPAPRARSRALAAAGRRSARAGAGACSFSHLQCRRADPGGSRANPGGGRHAGPPPGGSALVGRPLCVGVLPGAAPGGTRVRAACVRACPARGRGARGRGRPPRGGAAGERRRAGRRARRRGGHRGPRGARLLCSGRCKEPASAAGRRPRPTRLLSSAWCLTSARARPPGRQTSAAPGTSMTCF